MAKTQNYEIRDELARHAICIWQDACAFHYTHDQLLEILAKRIWGSPKYKRLPLYMREYVRGYARSFEVNVMNRMALEFGRWVRMPDGSEKWYGTAERVKGEVAGEELSARYISEHAIPEKSGIYWIVRSQSVTEYVAGRYMGVLPGKIDYSQSGKFPFSVGKIETADENKGEENKGDLGR